MGDAAAEMLAKEMQAIVAADRWKGRDLSAAPPEKWSHLRPETQQFWIDTAARILAALPAASGEDNATLRDRLARQATEIARLTRIVQMQPAAIKPAASAEDVRAGALKEAEKVLRDWQDNLNVQRMPETAVTIGMAADLVAALTPGAKP